MSKTQPGETVQVDQTEWELFQHFRGWLLKTRANAQRLSGERTTHDFGVYGKIKATEREIRLAELEVATLKSEPLPVTYLSLATGLSESEIEALRQGGGANPDYHHVAAYYQLRETRSEILSTIKEYKELVAGLPVDERGKAYGQILKLQDQLLNLLPRPKKKEPLDFGDRDSTAAEDLARRAVVDMLLTEPPSETRDGGPGPLR